MSNKQTTRPVLELCNRCRLKLEMIDLVTDLVLPIYRDHLRGCGCVNYIHKRMGYSSLSKGTLEEIPMFPYYLISCHREVVTCQCISSQLRTPEPHPNPTLRYPTKYTHQPHPNPTLCYLTTHPSMSPKPHTVLSY